jgi:hypothetical protein
MQDSFYCDTCGMYKLSNPPLTCSVQRFPHSPCLSHRPMKYDKPGPYKWQTYREVGEAVDAVAGGIMQLCGK